MVVRAAMFRLHHGGRREAETLAGIVPDFQGGIQDDAGFF